MYKTEFGCPGCLTLILVLLLFPFLFKSLLFLLLFLLIVPIFLLFIYKTINYKDFLQKITPKKEFVSTPGNVYKQCSFCNKKANRNADFCDNCGRPL